MFLKKEIVVNKRILLFFLFVLTFPTKIFLQLSPPKITVVMIIDQFAYHYIEKLRNHFKYGLKEMLDSGICYENAYHAHGSPETAPGHQAISTGVLPKDHGISGNKWLDKEGKTIRFNSPMQTKVDGLSDQFVMLSTSDLKHHVYSFSLKDRAAIGTANKLGKALWYTDKAGGFVSSNDYFEELPAWLKTFNEEHDTRKIDHVTWKTLYSQDSPAYKFQFAKNYDYAVVPSLIDREKISIKVDEESKDPHKNLYFKIPDSSKLIFDAAKACVENILENNEKDKILLWLSLSNLDLLVHFYGPDSIEAIDLIYQLDKQMHDFMNYLRTKIDDKDILFAFTSDHGIQPIQEIVQKKGLKNARRIMAKPLIKDMNEFIKEKYKIDDLVLKFSATYFFLDQKKLKELAKEKQQKILNDLKKHLLKQKGIRQVWTRDELKKAHFEPYEKESFYKNQIYRDRVGELICMPHPYCLISNYSTGCSHHTPYDYDTHVPLILYRKGIPHKIIREKVWIPQLPVTLARMMHVSRPSASTFNLLPGAF